MVRRSELTQLCAALLEARQKKGLTQIDVANFLGKPQSFVSKYESGERRLDVIEFIAVCKALSIDPAKIIKYLEKNHE